MGAKDYYRRYIEKMIQTNPVEITVTRTSIIDDGFGGTKKEKVTLPAQTVTFYNRKSMREVVGDAGQVANSYLARVTKVLATADADLQEGDQFEYGGKTWRVAYVADYLGVCRQAELEVVVP
jgi:hypothetical protein